MRIILMIFEGPLLWHLHDAVYPLSSRGSDSNKARLTRRWTRAQTPKPLHSQVNPVKFYFPVAHHAS